MATVAPTHSIPVVFAGHRDALARELRTRAAGACVTRYEVRTMLGRMGAPGGAALSSFLAATFAEGEQTAAADALAVAVSTGARVAPGTARTQPAEVAAAVAAQYDASNGGDRMPLEFVGAAKSPLRTGSAMRAVRSALGRTSTASAGSSLLGAGRPLSGPAASAVDRLLAKVGAPSDAELAAREEEIARALLSGIKPPPRRDASAELAVGRRACASPAKEATTAVTPAAGGAVATPAERAMSAQKQGTAASLGRYVTDAALAEQAHFDSGGASGGRVPTSAAHDNAQMPSLLRNAVLEVRTTEGQGDEAAAEMAAATLRADAYVAALKHRMHGHRRPDAEVSGGAATPRDAPNPARPSPKEATLESVLRREVTDSVAVTGTAAAAEMGATASASSRMGTAADASTSAGHHDALLLGAKPTNLALSAHEDEVEALKGRLAVERARADAEARRAEGLRCEVMLLQSALAGASGAAEAAAGDAEKAVAAAKGECKQLRSALIRCKEELLAEREAIRAKEEQLLLREKRMLATLMQQLQATQRDVHRLDNDAQSMEAMQGRIESLHELVATSEVLAASKAEANVRTSVLPVEKITSLDLFMDTQQVTPNQKGAPPALCARAIDHSPGTMVSSEPSMHGATRILSELGSLKSQLTAMA